MSPGFMLFSEWTDIIVLSSLLWHMNVYSHVIYAGYANERQECQLCTLFQGHAALIFLLLYFNAPFESSNIMCSFLIV